jgi:autotransporter-associated beta strand protein
LNWTGQEVPGPGDSALFTSGPGVKNPNCVIDGFVDVGSITMDSSWGGSLTVPSGAILTVDSGISLSSGTIVDDGAVGLSGDCLWNGGTIGIGTSAGASWTSSGTLTIDTSSNELFLTGGGTFTNSGTITEQGLNALVLEFSSVLNNEGTYNFADDNSVILLNGENGATGTLINSGTLEKTGGVKTSVIGTTFNNNSGTIDSETGSISLQTPFGAGGTLDGGTLDAGIVGLATASIDLTSAMAVEGSFSGSGSGTVDLEPGFSRLSVTNAGASFNFPSTLLQWTNGMIDVSSGGTLTNNGVLNLNTAQNSVALNGAGELANAGTVNESGTNHLLLEGNITLDNTATFDITSDAGITQASGTLVNSGLLEKTGGSATSVIQASFDNNDGTIDVLAGTLSLDSQGLINGANLEVAGAATLNLTGGTTVDCQGTIAGSGAGTIELPNGTLIVTSSGATFDMPGNLFQWTGGAITINSGGTLTNPVGSVLAAASVILNGPGTLENNGTISEAGTGDFELENSAILNNTGTFDFISNSGIAEANVGMLVNTGLVEKTAGTGNSSIASSFDNNGGTIDAAVGIVTLQSASGLINGATLETGSAAMIGLSGGGPVDYQGTITGSGAGLIVNGGNVVITSTGATFDMPGTMFQWFGTINLSGGGTLTNASTGEMNINTGSSNAVLNGTGTLQNDGTINDTGANGFSFEIGNGVTLVNAGVCNTSSFSAIGQVFAGTFSNTGIVNVNGGSALFEMTVPQISGTTLTGGVWNVSGSGNLDILFAPGIQTVGNGASVILNGSSASFTNLTNNFAAIQSGGSFSLFSGASYQGPNGVGFTNDGNLILGAGSSLKASGVLTEGSTANLTVQVGEVGSVSSIGSVIDKPSGNTSGISLAGSLTVTSTVIPNGVNGFTIVSGGPVSGTFSGLPSGSTFTVTVGTSKLVFQILYAASSVSISPRIDTWTGAGGNANWTNPSNWGGTAPAIGDILIFGPGAARLTNANNFPVGSAFNSIIFSGSGYSIGGDGIVLLDGMNGTNATGANTFGPAITLASAESIVAGGSSITLTLGGAIANGGFTLTLGPGPGVITVDKPISGAGGLVTSAGAVTLQAVSADTYKGGTVASGTILVLDDAGGVAIPGALTVGAAGTSLVQLDGSNQIAAGATVTVKSLGTLDCNGNTNTLAKLILDNGKVTTEAGALAAKAVTAGGTSSIAGNLVVPTAITTGTASTLTVTAVISGTGNLTVAGPGTLTLAAAGANTYIGSTIVQSGTLVLDDTGGVAIPGALTIGTKGTSLVQLAASNQIAGTATVTVDSLGTFDCNGNTNTLNKLILSSGTVTTEAGTLAVPSVTDTGTSSIAGNWTLPSTITVNAASTLTVSAVLSGSGGLTKAGPGTLVLTGNNAYTGATIVVAGTLLVDGQQTGSTMTVKSGATLRGTGAVGTVNVLAGGAMLPGAGASATGTLTTGRVTFASTSSFNVTLDGTTPGSQYDQLAAEGTISLAGSTLNITLGFTPSIGTIFTIIHNSSGKPISGTFAGLADGATFTEDGMTFQISYKGGGGNDVTLARTA